MTKLRADFSAILMWRQRQSSPATNWKASKPASSNTMTASTYPQPFHLGCFINIKRLPWWVEDALPRTRCSTKNVQHIKSAQLSVILDANSISVPLGHLNPKLLGSLAFTFIQDFDYLRCHYYYYYVYYPYN